jgi:hypothetical protein
MGTLNIRPLDIMFNAVVHTMAKRCWTGWFDTGPEAPASYESLMAEYERRGRITVWNGASDRTIFDDPDINIMFRSWHDWCHIMGRHDFSLQGENEAAKMQCRMVIDRYGDSVDSQRWCNIIMAEVVGQALYEAQNGRFPDDQMAFTKTWLSVGPASALNATF